MKILELKHLAPYLPYGIRVSHNSALIGSSLKVSLLSQDIITIENGITFAFNQVKPILRPMCDFNKEIEMHGYPKIESILSYINIAKTEEYTFHPKINCLRLKTCRGYNQWNFNVNGQLDLPYRIVKVLIENHFDIFGLIAQGLAIDVNTISS